MVYIEGCKPFFPVIQRLIVRYTQRQGGDAVIAVPVASGVRKLKEGQLCARIAGFIAVEQVVDGDVILVDCFFDQPESQHFSVEFVVFRSFGCNGGYMVKAF
ncbi:hypothetical protein D3C80_1696920 [compost metagenome]